MNTPPAEAGGFSGNLCRDLQQRAMTCDPFGDRDTRGYLRNRLGTNDPSLIAQGRVRLFGTLPVVSKRQALVPGPALSPAHQFPDPTGHPG